ncbi:hypothetical protein [Zhongshania borealis]|uniref:DUF3592 domain-containing protein n=1 Tax=Zhongshania borealis TaxID=889488 RepID=A0ABP7WUN3_9GAMM
MAGIEMFGSRTVEKQRAQSPRWLSFLIATFVSAFSVMLFPFAHDFLPLWFSGLCLVAYMLARGTMGIRSWISVDGAGKYMLCMRDNASRANVYVPFDYIDSVALCEYVSWTEDNTPPAYKNLPYHRTYSQLAYQGPGLIVDYTSPKHLGGDGQLRSWRIPAPRAQVFLAIFKAEIPCSIRS